jgi:hypothetical protein
MNKTYGVCLGLLALGLVGLGTPAAHARGSLATGGAVSDSDAAVTATASTATASSHSDSVLVAENDGNDTAAATADAPQDPTPAPAATTPPAPTPLPTPSVSGPLATAIPHEIPAGPFGKIEVTGVLSGIGLFGNNPQTYLGDTEGHIDVSNAMVFIQKTSGWFQFFLQGGAYNLPVVGYPFLKTTDTTKLDFGAFPVGYVKLVKGSFNVEIGALPTLIGDEYIFTFENMNIERGLLWNQEPVVSRGIQFNNTYKKLTLSLSWNDGFYSNRYTSLSGLAAFAINSSNTLTFAAGGNAGSYVRTGPNSFPTPVFQNNEQVFNLIYTYTKGSVTVSPYYQYTVVKSNNALYGTGAHTNGAAILANYNFKHGFSFSVRPEYIKSSGSAITGEANLLGYGPGSGAFSFTATPTWVKDAFFLRGDFSYVHIADLVAGSGFGTTGSNTNQARAAIEAGFMF